MESLLSLSFDYLSSYDGIKVRKGLRQLEGLLAQICLSRSNTNRRSSIAVTNGVVKKGPKELGELKDDPAFREFFKLQEGFECNSMKKARPSQGKGRALTEIQSQCVSPQPSSVCFHARQPVQTIFFSSQPLSSSKALS